MSLRARIHWAVASLMVLMMVVLTAVDIRATREAVREEIQASHIIATQLVRDVLENYAAGDSQELLRFLQRVGRIRSNDIALYDNQSELLYRSPRSTYKEGRNAPRWYAWLVTPNVSEVSFPLRGGSLEIRANPTRSVLDGWDGTKVQTVWTLVLLLIINGVVFLVVGRGLEPLDRIREALVRIARGDLSARLPAFSGKEASAIGSAVNSMAQAIEDRRKADLLAAQAQARLGAEQRFVVELQSRIEDERRDLAATLHDELGQSLTAVRTLSHALVQRCSVKQSSDPVQHEYAAHTEKLGQLLMQATDELYDAMHRLIPRLRPPSLDKLGICDALSDLVDGLRQQHPGMDWHLQTPDLRIQDEEPGDGLAMPALSEAVQTCVYRVVQEALNNIVKHARATRVDVALTPDAEGSHSADPRLHLLIADNGAGMNEPGPVDGRFGLYGMVERVQSLGGSISFGRAEQGGLMIDISLPLP